MIRMRPELLESYIKRDKQRDELIESLSAEIDELRVMLEVCRGRCFELEEVRQELETQIILSGETRFSDDGKDETGL